MTLLRLCKILEVWVDCFRARANWDFCIAVVAEDLWAKLYLRPRERRVLHFISCLAASCTFVRLGRGWVTVAAWARISRRVVAHICIIPLLFDWVGRRRGSWAHCALLNLLRSARNSLLHEVRHMIASASVTARFAPCIVGERDRAWSGIFLPGWNFVRHNFNVSLIQIHLAFLFVIFDRVIDGKQQLLQRCGLVRVTVLRHRYFLALIFEQGTCAGIFQIILIQEVVGRGSRCPKMPLVTKSTIVLRLALVSHAFAQIAPRARTAALSVLIWCFRAACVLELGRLLIYS